MSFGDRFFGSDRSRGRWRDDDEARRDGRETQWQDEGGFGGGWGNQAPRVDDDRGERFGGDFGRDRSDIRSGGPGWDREREREPRYELGGRRPEPFSEIAPSGGRDYGFGGGFERGPGHDPNYSQWRERQIAALDRDYEEYRREHQSKFDREFGAWRDTRGKQREAVSRVTENMEVVGADGVRVGAVDKVRGDSLLLNRKDPDSGGVHHSIPCGWIATVDDKVILNLDGEEAKRRWREESRSRALFEREDSGSDGPHVLGRAFSGTYGKEG